MTSSGRGSSGSGGGSSSSGSTPGKIRLKCHYNQDIRAVAITERTTFAALTQRLKEDYGFDVALKYAEAPAQRGAPIDVDFCWVGDLGGK